MGEDTLSKRMSRHDIGPTIQDDSDGVPNRQGIRQTLDELIREKTGLPAGQINTQCRELFIKIQEQDVETNFLLNRVRHETRPGLV